MNTAEKIYELVQRLPAFSQVEILDFASYLEHKIQQETICDESLDENDILHSNNREWLLGKLAEADEDIKADRVVPSSKALFDDVIARGRARSAGAC